MLLLRSYLPEDARTIVSWVGDHIAARMWSANIYHSFPVTPDDMNRFYSSQNGTPFVMEEDGKAVGHLSMRRVNGGEIRLGFVIVDPEKRGKGYGKALVLLALKHAFGEMNVPAVTLAVFDGNTQARECYLSAGFRDLGEKEKYNIDGEEWTASAMRITSEEYYSRFCKGKLLVRTLIDNRSACGLAGEWGLSFLADFRGKKYLLDFGSSGSFADNAQKLGIDLRSVDAAVLSHAHYDHSDGLERFCTENTSATIYLRDGYRERYFASFVKYIGIKRRLIKRFSGRFSVVSGVKEIGEGVYLVPHSTQGLDALGKAAKMHRRKGLRYIPDDFSHEQTLVFDTEKGLAVFNSCSHGGVGNIIRECSEAFPGKKVTFFFGGMHLFASDETVIRALGEELGASGLEAVFTGHCTGKRAFEILSEYLPGKIHPLRSGFTEEI